MTPDTSTDIGAEPDAALESPAPACVMSFNASDPSGASGLAGDIATIAAMGAHALPIVTTILMRDTAEVFEQHLIEGDAIIEQARCILEDVTLSGFKVGFLGSAENVSAVAEVLADYAEVPLVSYLPALGWMEDDELQPYLDAFRELILPATEVLVGSHKTLTDFLLPDWESDRPASPRELAVAAGDHGTRFVLVTGVMLPAKTGKLMGHAAGKTAGKTGGKAADKAGAKAPAAPLGASAAASSGTGQFIDNVLASPQGALTGEKFEMFETTFVGAGDSLAAALASLLAVGTELQAAVGEALQFLDQSLDAGFRPGMGGVIPDRFFWALPPPEDGEPGSEPAGPIEEPANPGGSRRVH